MSDDCFRPAADVAADVRAGTLSPVTLLDQYLDRIDERGDRTNAFVTVLADEARERAREVETAVERGDDPGPLAGVPVAIKDLGYTKTGVRHTYGMAPFADNVADRTTVAVERLESAGAVVVGTTNTPELGHTVRTDNELVGPTATPFDPERNAGGSSGGSAAAVADGLCALATGSDVGGSLRTPASCCGVVSVKPSFGVVPRDARPDAFRTHTPFGVLGPMARTVEDVALAMDVLAGPADADPYSVPRPDDESYTTATERDAADLDVGYSPDLDRFAVDPAVRDTVGDAVSDLADAGATVESVAVGGPEKGELVAAYGTQATTLFATLVRELNEAHGMDLLDDHADDLRSSFAQTVRMGRGYDALDYTTADTVRTRLYDAVEETLDGYDALVCPALATPPLAHDEPLPTEVDGESVAGLPMDWTLSWPFNLTGHPVVTVPAGLVDGLPVGMQVVAGRYDERSALAVASVVERVRPWREDYPGLDE
ncbi:amidase [Halomarina salina]|uniref:Amidase n=1 Tax=Halomarina salina TaxID=1872699 RepID=A0ABD5RJ85_9EURY|nr:amidase [Halomarina salina]